MKVFAERDKVMIDLCGWGDSFLLSCDEALRLAEALDESATEAAMERPSRPKGERWFVYVESYGGKVGFRFLGPKPGTPRQVPIPPHAARQLADKIRSQEAFAEHNMRIILTGGI